MSSTVAAGTRGFFEDGSEQAFIPAVRCSRLDVCASLSVPIYSVPEVIVADESIFGLRRWSLNLIGLEDYKAFLFGFQPQEHVEGKARGLGGMGRCGSRVERPHSPVERWRIPAAIVAGRRKCYTGLL